MCKMLNVCKKLRKVKLNFPKARSILVIWSKNALYVGGGGRGGLVGRRGEEGGGGGAFYEKWAYYLFIPPLNRC